MGDELAEIKACVPELNEDCWMLVESDCESTRWASEEQEDD